MGRPSLAHRGLGVACLRRSVPSTHAHRLGTRVVGRSVDNARRRSTSNARCPRRLTVGGAGGDRSPGFVTVRSFG